MRIRSMLSAVLIACASSVFTTHAIEYHPEPQQVPPRPTQYTTPNPESLIKAKVVRVFDADTILVEVEGIKYRYQLLASNAPEHVPSEHAKSSYSHIARIFMQQLLLDESVYLQHDPTGIRDSFGRRSAYVFRAPDMLFVNLELIRQAYAQYDTRDTSLYTRSFEYYQAIAKSRSRGIWNPDQSAVDWSDPANTLHADPDPMLIQTDEPKSNHSTPQQPEQTENKPDPSLPVIFITKSGKKYHTKDCAHLSGSLKETTREAIKETHQPCKSCKPDDQPE